MKENVFHTILAKFKMQRTEREILHMCTTIALQVMYESIPVTPK